MPAGTVSMRYLILGLLARQSMSGYDIQRLWNKLDWLVGRPSTGGLYPSLRRLLDQGLVSVEVLSQGSRPPRKSYSITVQGRAAFTEWLSRPASAGTLKSFLMRLMLAGNVPPATLVSQLQQRRTEVARNRDALDQLAVELRERGDLGQRLALEYGLAVASAELAWLNDTMGRMSAEGAMGASPEPA